MGADQKGQSRSVSFGDAIAGDREITDLGKLLPTIQKYPNSTSCLEEEPWSTPVGHIAICCRMQIPKEIPLDTNVGSCLPLRLIAKVDATNDVLSEISQDKSWESRN